MTSIRKPSSLPQVDSQVLQGRFEAILVDQDSYLLELFRHLLLIAVGDRGNWVFLTRPI